MPAGGIVIFAVLVLAGDNAIETAENPEPIDRHWVRSLQGAASPDLSRAGQL